MPDKPVIAYTTPKKPDFLHFATGFAIWLAGGKPLAIKPETRLPDFDGLVICGGSDINPANFMKDIDHELRVKDYDDARDETELSCLKWAEENNKPVLGICRGAQLMNIYRGGNLHLDIGKAYERAKYPSSLFANAFFRKPVNIKDGTKFQDIVQSPRICINSMHRQAINDLGQNLIENACEDNGVIQGIEDPDRPYFVGVQFHPEVLIYRRKFRRIFSELVKSAGVSKAKNA